MSAVKSIGGVHVKLLTAGWSPRTDRFYPSTVLTTMTEQFEPGLGDLIYAGDDYSVRLDLHMASHRTERLYLKENGTELWAYISILDTEAGNLLLQEGNKDTIRFDCFMVGKVNRFSEVDPQSVHYIRVVAFFEPTKSFKKK